MMKSNVVLMSSLCFSIVYMYTKTVDSVEGAR